jgi:hypothetical protein
MEGSDRQAADLLVTQGTLFWGVGKDVAGVDSSLVDEQGRMVGAGKGSQNGKGADNTGNPQRTEGQVPSTGSHKGGRSSQHQCGRDWRGGGDR